MSAVNVDLTAQNATVAQTINADEGADTIINFEDVIGSDFGDVIIGNSSANTLEGRGGADTLTGNGGSDTYVFRSEGDSAVGAGDTIMDFNAGDNQSGIDAIDLSGIIIGSFTYIGDGTANFTDTGATQARFVDGTNGGKLEVDVNGDTAVDMDINMTNVSSINFDDSDFNTIAV